MINEIRRYTDDAGRAIEVFTGIDTPLGTLPHITKIVGHAAVPAQQRGPAGVQTVNVPIQFPIEDAAGAVPTSIEDAFIAFDLSAKAEVQRLVAEQTKAHLAAGVRAN